MGDDLYKNELELQKIIFQTKQIAFQQLKNATTLKYSHSYCLWCSFAKSHGQKQGSQRQSTKNNCTRRCICQSISGVQLKLFGIPGQRTIEGIMYQQNDKVCTLNIDNIVDEQQYYYIKLFGEHQLDGSDRCNYIGNKIKRYIFSERENQLIVRNLIQYGGRQGIKSLWNDQCNKGLKCSYQSLLRRVEKIYTTSKDCILRNKRVNFIIKTYVNDALQKQQLQW
ncbi:Hypothetical_protein [Hexamita inflata]|uniref:Hypothetical_protein n=1 Tax=Hexamita inflata TaxID=28002 RepID=A0AA86RAB0_9EUKA|nr:Hypothetical protein HINF_LOCUS52165 [Hexamita inflata]